MGAGMRQCAYNSSPLALRVDGLYVRSADTSTQQQKQQGLYMVHVHEEKIVDSNSLSLNTPNGTPSFHGRIVGYIPI